jgi:glycosyltransferase involved in cell wall biosynthesis
MPIRVCYLIDRLGPGGTEWQLLALLRHLDRAQVEPYLVLLRGEDDESRPLEPSDCPVLRLGVGSLCRPRTIAQAWRFARFLRRERIDVLQTYFADSSYFGMLAARLAGLRHVVRTRFNLGYWMTPLHRWLGRGITTLSSATVTNSEECRRAVVGDEWADPATVQVIPNGVDHGPFLAIPALERQPRRIGMLARLRPVKDPGLFIDAARLILERHPGVEFELGGDGELRDHLESRIRSWNLTERFRFLGRIDDVPAFLKRLDIAVLSSRSEGSPNAVLEYMAAGRAIVATAVGGTLALLDDGVHGLLVPAGDAAAMARALGRLLDNAALAARLGRAARQRALERHEPRQRAIHYEGLYRRLLGKSESVSGGCESEAGPRGSKLQAISQV